MHTAMKSPYTNFSGSDIQRGTIIVLHLYKNSLCQVFAPLSLTSSLCCHVPQSSKGLPGKVEFIGAAKGRLTA